jgi:ABC-type microcin C transport system duplicated ATPase subunit YejF
VLQDFNLTVEPNQTVALVGTSGSGAVVVLCCLLRLGNSCVRDAPSFDASSTIIDGILLLRTSCKHAVLSYLLVCVTLLQASPRCCACWSASTTSQPAL